MKFLELNEAYNLCFCSDDKNGIFKCLHNGYQIMVLNHMAFQTSWANKHFDIKYE